MDFFGGGRLHLHCLLGLLSNRPRQPFFASWQKAFPLLLLATFLLPQAAIPSLRSANALCQGKPSKTVTGVLLK